MKRANWSFAPSVRMGIMLQAALIAWGGLGLSSVSAQDNPIPLNWRNLTVQVIETYGNNNTKALLGAKVTVELKDPYKAEELKQRYPTLHLPQTKTAQTTGARFGQLPPSSEVGPYIVTVDPKPNDNQQQYVCEEQTNRASREMRMGGGSDQRLTFNFTCQQADAVNEFERRAQGGYDLTVQIKESGGTRGNGLWVYLYDNTGNRVKQVRTGGNAKAEFRAIDPGKNPYKIEIKKGNLVVFTDNYNMPAQNVTYTADLDNGGGQGGGYANGNAASYNLTVKLDLWVHVYDKNGKLVKKERLDNSSSATFNNLKADYNPYKIEVYSSNKLLYSSSYEMPSKHATYSIK